MKTIAVYVMALFTSKKTAVITAEKVLQYWSQTVVEQLIKTSSSCVDKRRKMSLDCDVEMTTFEANNVQKGIFPIFKK